jgi:multiple sugar transport system substrate-binding protein
VTKFIYGLSALFFLGVAQASSAEFTLEQIPPLTNQRPITLVAETGFWTEYLEKDMLPKFTQKTGVKVKVISTNLDSMFKLQTEGLLGGEGAYDLLTMEAGWAKEWAANGYTVPLLELASLYDPQGSDAMSNYLTPYYPSLMSILSYHGQFHAIPYNNYVMGNHYRADLFAHPEEQAAFAGRYGYPLEPPSSLKQLQDIAEFFTRKPGEMLAGKRLSAPLYGVALMSGNRPHINDEFSSILWSLGGAWLRPSYDKNGLLHHFTVPMHNAQAIEAAQVYQRLMNFAIPADSNFAFMEAADALSSGAVAMWPFAYNNLWSKSFEVEQRVPGARLAVAQVPGGTPYNGAYAFAVAYDSKNPQASYWLLKYMGSFQAQRAYAFGGGNPCRADVVLAPEFQTEENRHIAGAFVASHEANLSWTNKINQLGHFTSSAMGQIYPELTKTCYAVSQQPAAAATEFFKLSNKIKELQNRYGEYPAIEQ